MSNTSYYLYQKYIKIGEQDWIPVYPAEYAISGDTGQNPVIKQENDPNCGYHDAEYRWHQEDISEAYICSGGNKYYEEIYQVSYDGGFNWENVVPEQTRQGSIYESGSSDCIEYRWVNMDISTDWICEGTTKYYKQKEQWKYTDSSIWVDVVPPVYQKGALYETESEDCGYVPPTPYHGKLKAYYSDSTEYEVPCNSSTTLTSGETRGHSTSYSSMTTAEVGDCVTIIGPMAFIDCSSLTSVIIGGNVITIGDQAFENCSGITSIDIPNTVTSIGGWAFLRCRGFTSLTIPDSVTTIGSGAFEDCTSLIYVAIPNSITKIKNTTFAGCISLTNINIPSAVTSIGVQSFESCFSLESITIPDGVTSIGQSAFEDCTGLTSVTIGSGITSIGNSTFYNCRNLTSITINAANPPTLSAYAFNGTNNCPIYVPAASVNAYKSASGWSTYASRIRPIP